MPQNAFFPRTRDLLISPKTTQRHFLFTLHPLSTVIFATAPVLAFVLLRNSNFNFHCYTQREAYSEICPEVRCDLSQLLSRKITKRIHSNKPASLNRLIYKSCLWALTECSPLDFRRSSIRAQLGSLTLNFMLILSTTRTLCNNLATLARVSKLVAVKATHRVGNK